MKYFFKRKNENLHHFNLLFLCNRIASNIFIKNSFLNSQYYEIMWTNSWLDIESMPFLLNTTVVLSANGGTAARSLQRTRRKGEQRPSSCYVFLLLPFRFSRYFEGKKRRERRKSNNRSRHLTRHVSSY